MYYGLMVVYLIIMYRWPENKMAVFAQQFHYWVTNASI